MTNWLDLVPEGALKPFPSKNITLLADNGISIVYIADDGHVYKRSIPYLIENEVAFYHTMNSTGFVPKYHRYDKYTLQIELIESEEVTDRFVFMDSCYLFLEAMRIKGVRHGDLTRPHVKIKDNKVKVIDWAEARRDCDPAPDKRLPNDEYWLKKTMQEILDDQLTGFDK